MTIKLTPEEVEEIQRLAMMQVFLYEQGEISHPNPYTGVFETRCSTLWHQGYNGGPYPQYNNAPTHEEELENYRAWYIGKLTKSLERTPSPHDEWLGPVRELMGHLSDILSDEQFAKIDTSKWNAVTSLVGKYTR